MKGVFLPAVLMLAALALHFAARATPTPTEEQAPAAPLADVQAELKHEAPAPQAFFDGREAPAEAVVMRNQVAAIKKTETTAAVPKFAGEEVRFMQRGPVRRTAGRVVRFLRHPFRPRLRGCG